MTALAVDVVTDICHRCDAEPATADGILCDVCRSIIDPEYVMPIGKPAAVYRIFADDGALLYVGCSGQVETRLANQLPIIGWKADKRVGSVTIEHYATRDEALTAEARAIRHEAPLCNFKDERPPLPEEWKVTPYRSEFLDRDDIPASWFGRVRAS